MSASSVPYDNPAIVTFAKELEAWRRAAGLNKKELADLLGYTDSYVGQIELRKNTPSEDFAKALDTFFKTNGLFHRLWERIFDFRGAVSMPPGFWEYVEREKVVTTARLFSLTVFNGLFQTEEYARAIIEATGTRMVDEYVARRMERQAILVREDQPVRVLYTFDESVLRRMVGSREVQRGQLHALLEVGERPNVMLNVVPHAAGYYLGLRGSFTVLGFEDGSHAAYSEAFGGGMLIEDPARVAQYAMDYSEIRGCTCHVEGTRSLIRLALEEL
ncbi:helix-turn-helix domain-containing protein [Actinomadura hibisca]|uniref:helix-turn-helix domain-containing protein n=1 Tax=Actinomadura hibisca TaxID=68565 RepID=UPI000832751F|nr:helix-turn-helix transcriptional regulator [Actinomadura hibisca]